MNSLFYGEGWGNEGVEGGEGKRGGWMREGDITIKLA